MAVYKLVEVRFESAYDGLVAHHDRKESLQGLQVDKLELVLLCDIRLV